MFFIGFVMDLYLYDQNFIDKRKRFRPFSRNDRFYRMSYSKGWDDCLAFLKSEFNLDCPYEREDGLVSSDEEGYDPEHYKI